jgi:hypothetical protein
MSEKNHTGCLIAALLVFGMIFLGITFTISDHNPDMKTAMTILGVVIICVFGYAVIKVDNGEW